MGFLKQQIFKEFYSLIRALIVAFCATVVVVIGNWIASTGLWSVALNYASTNILLLFSFGALILAIYIFILFVPIKLLTILIPQLPEVLFRIETRTIDAIPKLDKRQLKNLEAYLHLAKEYVAGDYEARVVVYLLDRRTEELFLYAAVGLDIDEKIGKLRFNKSSNGFISSYFWDTSSDNLARSIDLTQAASDFREMSSSPEKSTINELTEILAVKLKLNGSSIGVLSVEVTDSAKEYDPTDIDRVEKLLEIAAGIEKLLA